MSYSNYNLLESYLAANRLLNHSEVKPSINVKPTDSNKPKEQLGIRVVCSRCHHKWLFISKKEHRIKPYIFCAKSRATKHNSYFTYLIFEIYYVYNSKITATREIFNRIIAR